MICNNCGNNISDNSRFCNHCGASVVKSVKKQFCTGCGLELTLDSVFCIRCGKKTDKAGDVVSNQAQPLQQPPVYQQVPVHQAPTYQQAPVQQAPTYQQAQSTQQISYANPQANANQSNNADATEKKKPGMIWFNILLYAVLLCGAIFDFIATYLLINAALTVMNHSGSDFIFFLAVSRLCIGLAKIYSFVRLNNYGKNGITVMYRAFIADFLITAGILLLIYFAPNYRAFLTLWQTLFVIGFHGATTIAFLTVNYYYFKKRLDNFY